MTAAITLSIYIARQFVGSVIGMLCALSGLVLLFDFIELLRRSASKPDATFALVSEIAVLRLPYMATQILPFAVLLGGILCFWRLTRSSELIVARAAGVSAWEFLAAPTLCAFAFGVFATAVVSPVSSAMLGRAEALDNTYLRTGGGPLALASGQLWLRQSDHMLTPQGVAIIHALGVELHGKQLTARQVSVFRLDGRDRLINRIEASEATLGPGTWQLANARVIRPDQQPEPPTVILLPTDLTVARVQESFASPDTLSFWALAGLHRAARSLRFLLDPSPAALPGIAGPAAARRHHGAGFGGLFHAPGAPRRCGTNDRRRSRGRIRPVPRLQDG